MQTNYNHEPQDRKGNSQTIKKAFDSLKKGNFKQANSLSSEKFNEQVRKVIKFKKEKEREEFLEDLESISRFVDKVRQTLKPDNLDDWVEDKRKESLKNLEYLAQNGSLIKSGEFLDQLSMTRQALCKARKSGRIFSVEIKGETYYPAFFTDPKYDRRQLEAVSRILGDLPGTSKLQFMLTPKGSLDSLTPLEALAKGKVGAVKISAEGFVGR